LLTSCITFSFYFMALFHHLVIPGLVVLARDTSDELGILMIDLAAPM